MTILSIHSISRDKVTTRKFQHRGRAWKFVCMSAKGAKIPPTIYPITQYADKRCGWTNVRFSNNGVHSSSWIEVVAPTLNATDKHYATRRGL